MSSFEKEITKIINDSYSGNNELFLKTVYQRAIIFLLMGGFGLGSALLIYKSGGVPIFTSIIGVILFGLGVFTHYTYNKCYKFLNKDE